MNEDANGQRKTQQHYGHQTPPLRHRSASVAVP
jgi:hypothetical protein